MKKNIGNLLFWSAFILSFPACITQVVIPSIPPPNWYTEPPLDSGLYWIGVGSAFTANQAEKQALSSISQRINTTITSNFKQRITSVTNSIGEEKISQDAKHELSTTTDAITFRAYSVKLSKRIGNNNYVLVKVDKNKFFQNYFTRLKVLNKELDDLTASLAREAIVVQLKGLQEIKPKVKEAEKIAVILSTYDRLPEANRHFNHYAELKAKEAQLRSKIKFYLKHDKSTRFVAKHFKEQVNKENFRVVTRFNANDRNIIYISIEGDMKNTKFDESFITKLIITLKAYATKKQVISSKQLLFSGDSITDFKLSLRAASNEFADHVQENGVLKTLGLITE